MPTSNSEQDRLRALRDRQLGARDPLVKQHRTDRALSQRYRRTAKPFSIGRMWSEIPHKWKGLVYGLSLGVLVLAILPVVWASSWAEMLATILIPVLGTFGFFIGQAFDARDELKNSIR